MRDKLANSCITIQGGNVHSIVFRSASGGQQRYVSVATAEHGVRVTDQTVGNRLIDGGLAYSLDERLTYAHASNVLERGADRELMTAMDALTVTASKAGNSAAESVMLTGMRRGQSTFAEYGPGAGEALRTRTHR